MSNSPSNENKATSSAENETQELQVPITPENAWDPLFFAPGSNVAKAAGCLCPVVDNNYGAGFPRGSEHPEFWVTQTCPIHGVGPLEVEGGDTHWRAIDNE